MNKQELKPGQEVWVKGVVDNDGDILLGNGEYIYRTEFGGLIFKTEPQKPVIPQFVAEKLNTVKLIAGTVYSMLRYQISRIPRRWSNET